ncbi:MAG: 3-dehydroquinate synthase [Clostridia bacterium]|nr:3-dehydroquinate synthase [Clostridia bacterium]
MAAVRINAGRPYDVHVGAGLTARAGELAASVLMPCRICVITDTTVERLYLETVRKSLSDAGFSVCSYAFPAGERSKNMETLALILEFLAESGITRSDALLALGGGVAGDITGFAAGVFLRGIRFVQMPTTLLAAVDSSVGGKTAVDLKAGKNLAGVFLQPSVVICDTDAQKTLPKETLADGVAEAVKTGVLFDEELFSLFENGGFSFDKLPFVIERCVEHKGRVVEADEFDRGERQLLNLGHTVGHAIERLSDYGISHGHAVAAGMGIISRAAAAMGICSQDTAKRIERALINNSLPVRSSYTSREISDAALSDKKRKGDEISLVVPERIGKCRLMKINVSELQSIIEKGTEA